MNSTHEQQRHQLRYPALVALGVLLAWGLPMRIARAEAPVASPAASASSASAVLKLDQFLDQVRKGNLGTQGALQASEGARLRSAEGDLHTSTFVFADYQRTRDAKPPQIPLYTFDYQNIDAFSFGFRKLTPIGLQAKL